MKTSFAFIIQNKCFTESFRKNWLEFCEIWYWHKVDPSANQRNNSPIRVKMDLLVWLYNYSAKNGYLDIDFEQFKRYVLGYNYISWIERNKPQEPKKPYRYRKKWAARTKYRKAEGHGIKDAEALEKKRLWDTMTGKSKDHRRRIRNFPRHPGRFYKQLRSKLHRRWVKQALYKESYDVFWSKDREMFIDPWTYD